MSAILQEPGFNLRPMSQGDIQRVMQIEVAAYKFHWTEGIFKDCLRVGYPSWVACIDEEVLGYGIMSVAVGEAHILNLCIDPQQQGMGYGRRLLKRMIRLAADHQADTLFLEVRVSNQVAQRLYESEGFVEIGQRRAYYPAADGEREDAVILAKTLI